MNGKEKCTILKDIRAQIAKDNDIEWIVSECKHQGNCLGTCPKCDAELRKLERELEFKRNLGHAVTVAGLSFMLAGCTIVDTNKPPKEGEKTPYEEPIDGDMVEPVEELAGEVEMYVED